MTCVAEALQLLLSLVSWDHKEVVGADSKKYVPSAVSVPTVKVTVQLEVALGASDGTVRLPFSRRAPFFEVVVDRW